MSGEQTHIASKLYQRVSAALVPSPEALGCTVGTVLGKGCFAKVKAAWCPYNKKMIAIKIIDKRKADVVVLTKFLPQEVAILCEVKHPNIIKTYCVVETEKHCFFIQEIAQNGDLLHYIRKVGFLIEFKARYVFRQICKAIAYCHKRDIVHRDLKPENLFFDKDMNVKIGDFGFATAMKVGYTTTNCGTYEYAAPELCDKAVSAYDGKKTDVWSLGVIIYAMLCGELPFKGRVQRGGELYYPLQLTLDSRIFIHHILIDDPVERPSIAEVQSHTWMKSRHCVKPTPPHVLPKYTTDNCLPNNYTISEPFQREAERSNKSERPIHKKVKHIIKGKRRI